MQILAFLNSYSNGKSGGDICFIEIFKRIPNIKLQVVTSKLGKQLCSSYKLKANYLLTTQETQFRFIILVYILRILKGIWTALIISKVDVIYVTSDALPDVIPAMFSKIRSPKATLIGKVFHIIPTNRIISSLAQQISHFFLKIIADTIIVDNSLLKTELVTEGFLSSKIIVNYPAVNFELLSKIKPRKKYSATCMSRLHESKGITDLIEIWELVVEKNANATLGIIGTGDKKFIQKIENLILKMNLQNNIDLLGFVEDEKAFSLIKGSDVFVFPSHEEGFGMVVAETLALGIPVVTYDLPIFHEVFPKSLSLVERFDKKIFAKQIMNVLNNRQKYDTVVTTGKKIVKTYSWESAATIEKNMLYGKN